MKFILAFILVFVFFNSPFAQSNSKTDSLVHKYKYALRIDAYRFKYKVPSLQLSFDYRNDTRFSFESELNYYLKYQNPERGRPLIDDLIIQLDSKKINFFVSGIAKVYIDKSKTFYAGLRGFVGVVNFNLKRNICTKSELSTSKEICRCLEFEDRKLDVRKILSGFGPRVGLNLPLGDRVLIDFYFDIYGTSSKKNVEYDSLQHDNSCTNLSYGWREPYFWRNPKAEGMFADELIPDISKTVFLYSVKVGYAF